MQIMKFCKGLLLLLLQQSVAQIMIFPYVDEKEGDALMSQLDHNNLRKTAAKKSLNSLKSEKISTAKTRVAKGSKAMPHNSKTVKMSASSNITHHSKENNVTLKSILLKQQRGVKKDILQNDPKNENVTIFESHMLTDDVIKQKVAQAKNIMESKYPHQSKADEALAETRNTNSSTTEYEEKIKAESSLLNKEIQRSEMNATLENTTKMAIEANQSIDVIPCNCSANINQQQYAEQAPANVPTVNNSAQDYGNILVSGPKNISQESLQRNEIESEAFINLTDALQKDVLGMWVYKDYIKSPADLMLDQGLINRAKISVSSGNRLRTLFEKALSGKDINAALITSAVTRAFADDPASQKWLYPNALMDWWHQTVTPNTNSSMIYKDVTLAGVGSDYFSRCLRSHLPDNGGTNLILWELSGSDYKPHGKLRPLDAQSLERFLRNTLEYHSNPELIILNFFRGNNLNRSAYCRELDEGSESRLAKHYDCTALSWSKSVCPYLTDDEEGFSYSYLFSRDRIHPSIIGHAQMAYILIDYVRDEFLNFLREPKPVVRSFTLPNAIFTQVFKPLCFTTLKAVNAPTDNDNSDLPVIFIASDPKEEATHRSRISNFSILPIILRFTLLDNDTDVYRTIGILPSFSKPLRTVVRLDNKPFVGLPVALNSSNRVIEIKPAVRLTNGPHMLRVWSLDKRFKVLALTLDTVRKASCSVEEDGCW